MIVSCLILGKADIKPEYKTIAKELANVLVSNPPRSIVITGHTDNVPAGPNFSSNLQLSALRAVNFAEILLQSNSKLDGRNFSTQGFGENRAVAPNDTKEGRAKNRRVEVLIQPLVTEDGSAVKSTK